MEIHVPMNSRYDNQSRFDASRRRDGDVQVNLIRKPSPNTKNGDGSKVKRNHCRRYISFVKGLMVRCLFLTGNLMVTWRVVLMTDMKWLWISPGICAFGLLIDFTAVTCCRSGKEWDWWNPCILIYLMSTLPLLWLIHLKQQEEFAINLQMPPDLMSELPESVLPTYSRCNGTNSICNVNLTESLMELVNETRTNKTTTSTTTTTTTTTTISMTTTATEPINLYELNLQTILNLSDETWVICINESIIYLIIFGRWFLPRGTLSREYLAGLLLEFLAIASDIMELLAVFDIPSIRANRNLNFWVLSIWSVSFIQFLPLLTHQRKKDQKDQDASNRHTKGKCCHCGPKCIEIAVTFMSILLQDGPFLALRLYIIIHLHTVTYSIVFFMLKNVFTIMLLFYRLIVLCIKACKRSNETYM